MAKTVKELCEELSNLLIGIMQVNSSFDSADLSQKIVEVTKEWKEARELEERIADNIMKLLENQ